MDIEVTTVGREGGVPLPHDEIISISITNGGWYYREYEDKCFCIYTMRTVSNTDWDLDRNSQLMRVGGLKEAVEAAYDVLNALSPDFVNIHNGFNFDLRAMASWSVFDPRVEPIFEEKRLGNVGIGTVWVLPNGVMMVDSMYSTDKIARSNWKSLALRALVERYDLPPKLDSDTMAIDSTTTADISNLLRYNARDADLHVWVAKETRMCQRMCALAEISRCSMWDSVANYTGLMDFCLMQSAALSRGQMLDLARNSDITDDRKFEGGDVVPPILDASRVWRLSTATGP